MAVLRDERSTRQGSCGRACRPVKCYARQHDSCRQACWDPAPAREVAGRPCLARRDLFREVDLVLELDLFFGRSFSDLVGLFGFKVERKPEGTKLLVPVEK